MKKLLSPNTLKLFNHNEVILINSSSGQWIKLSKEIYNIMSRIEKDNLELNKELFEHENDFNFIKETLEEMELIGILSSVSINDIVENVSLEITDKCNLRCKHCCMNALSKYDSGSEEVNTENLKLMISNIINLKPKSIMISGGEPMIRQDFFEISNYLRENYRGITILSTNGTLIDSSNAGKLSKLYDVFEISIDGIDEKTTAELRGKGIFKKVIKAVEHLKNYNSKIHLSMVFGDKNEHLKGKFKLLNKKLGTIPHERGFFRVGRGDDNYNILLSEENKNMYIPESFINQKIISGVSCKALSKLLMIKCNGNIYPCPSLMDNEFYIGNILKEDFIHDIQHINYVKLFLNKLQVENYLLEDCKKCNLKYFCWTCPGEALEYKKNTKLLKEKCGKIKNILYQKVWEI